MENKKFIGWIFLTALALRVIFVLFLEDRFYFSDSLQYEDCAMRLLHGGGFGDYARAPLYPVWMALIFGAVGGKNLLVLRLVESLVSAGLSVAVFALGTVLHDSKTAVVAAVVATFYPMFIFLPALNYPTLLGTFFAIVAIYLVALANARDKITWTLMAGVLFGFAALSVAPLLTLPLAIVIWLLLFSRFSWRSKILHAALLCSGFLLTLAPWTTRNYLYYHEFVPIRHDATAHFLPKYNDEDSRRAEQIGVDEKVSRVFHDPQRFLESYAANFVRFWRLTPSPHLKSSDPDYNRNIYRYDQRITRRNIFSTSGLFF